MKLFLVISLGLVMGVGTKAQELYIMADPASNIPANSLSLRITNMAMPMLDRERTSLRQELSVAAGLHKNLMAKASMYAGNMFTGKYRLEAGALYAKYRFLSNDDFHKHFRMAAFGKLTFSGNPIGPQKWITHQNPDGTTHTEMSNHLADELNIDGNHSGLTAGITATWLVHKLAVSGTGGFVQRFNNLGQPGFPPSIARQAVHYSLSAGYLLLPVSYKSYNQTNFNVYWEWLGGRLLDKKGYFADAAPGIQLIFKSRTRLEATYRFQVAGNMSRFNNRQWLVRLEHNLFGALKSGKGTVKT